MAERIAAMGDFLRAEVAAGRQYLPAGPQVLRAFERPMAQVRVLIVGQDPYPTPGHPIGLSFAVDRHVRPLPRSLGNIYRELRADIGIAPPAHGDLTAWSDQGVLLLNRVLTVDRVARVAPRQGLGTDHRGGDPRAGATWWPAGRGAVGQGRADAAAVAWTAPRSSRRRTRHRCPPTAGSSDPGRSPTVNTLLVEQGGEPVDWAL